MFSDEFDEKQKVSNDFGWNLTNFKCQKLQKPNIGKILFKLFSFEAIVWDQWFPIWNSQKTIDLTFSPTPREGLKKNLNKKLWNFHTGGGVRHNFPYQIFWDFSIAWNMQKCKEIFLWGVRYPLLVAFTYIRWVLEVLHGLQFLPKLTTSEEKFTSWYIL